MENIFSRTELLIGENNLQKLKNSKVAVFGVGGVGGYVVEGLVRAGIGNIIIVDNDKISLTNINRQIIATHNTIGQYKVDVMKERILSINPNCIVTTFKDFYLPGNNSNILDGSINYVVDCIDTITAKIELIINCKNLNIPIISCMGTGNKLDPTKFEITDIYKTSICPLAKVMRHELKKRGIKKLDVIYSTEEPIKPIINYTEENVSKRQIPGSISFVPSVAGLMLAGKVVNNLLNN